MPIYPPISASKHVVSGRAATGNNLPAQQLGELGGFLGRKLRRPAGGNSAASCDFFPPSTS